MKKMTVREKVLMGILGVLVLFCVYYFVFLIPTTEKLDACINENLTIEEQLVIYDATAEKKSMMETELEAIFNGEKGNVKELPAYDNSQNVMNQLSFILSDAEEYEISFSGVEEVDSTVRRGVSLNFTCKTYEVAKRILKDISESEYRCILKDLYLNCKESNEQITYIVIVDVVFFEYN